MNSLRTDKAHGPDNIYLRFWYHSRKIPRPV